MKIGTLLCAIGLHRWSVHGTSDGKTYHDYCGRCSKPRSVEFIREGGQ